jgi:hypothetical protein
MPVALTKALYAKMKGRVAIRRYTGTGASRPFFDWSARARVTGYTPEELTGTIQQGDRKAIVFVQDLVDTGFPLPVTTNDKLVDRDREFQIVVADHNTRRDEDVLIAIEIQARGQG